MKRKKWFIIGAVILLAFGGCGKANAVQSESTVPSQTEQNNILTGTIFTYGDKEYDIAKRQAAINAITSVIPVGQYIVVEGHVSPQNSVYCIFDTATQEFSKDIVGANLIWHDDDITTAVYAFGADICNYSGDVIATCELTGAEYISKLAFADDYAQLEVTVMTEEGETHVEIHSLSE